MITVQAIDTTKNRAMGECNTITFRFYQDMRCALSDVLDGNSDIHAAIDDYGMCVGDASKPDRIYCGGTDHYGYMDDFHFAYSNGITIVLGESVIEEEIKKMLVDRRRAEHEAD